MAQLSTPSEDLCRPTGDFADVLCEIRNLARMLMPKAHHRRPRFPHLCKNGASCAFLACGTCWFTHEHDLNAKQPPPVCFAAPASEQATDKNTEPQHQIDKKLAAMQATLDNKMADFANYVDRRLAEVDSKLEAMAEAFIKDEAGFPQPAKKDPTPNTVSGAAELNGTQVRAIKLDIMKDLSETFQNGVRRSFEEFGKIIEARIEKIESKIGLTTPDPSDPPLSLDENT